MDGTLRSLVRCRAGDVCEYCRLPQAVPSAPRPLDGSLRVGRHNHRRSHADRPGHRAVVGNERLGSRRTSRESAIPRGAVRWVTTVYGPSRSRAVPDNCTRWYIAIADISKLDRICAADCSLGECMTLMHSANGKTLGAGGAMTVRRIDYGTWLLKFVAWDGVLPAVVLLVPIVVEVLFPNCRDAMAITAVALPIAVFLFRFFVAKRHICSNRCSALVRRVQLVALCVAIFVLLLIDSLMIVAREAPKGALFQTETDVVTWAALIVIYLLCMAFAMFPGPANELPPGGGRDF